MEFRCKLVEWNEIEKWCKIIVKKVKADRYVPDVIIGLARGGLVPARLLSDYMHIKDLYAVKTEHWGITATPDREARLAQPLQVDISGKKVLVVDDITDTGKSLKLALKHIAEYEPSEIRSATLLHITHSSYVPNYYAEHVPAEEWTWFIFPWNFYEDLRNLVLKIMSDEPIQIEKIFAEIKRRYSIEVPKDKIEEVLEELREWNKIEKDTLGWIKKIDR